MVSDWLGVEKRAIYKLNSHLAESVIGNDILYGVIMVRVKMTYFADVML